MKITVSLTETAIPARPWSPPGEGAHGALAEFHGIVRGTEDGTPIGGLRYRAYTGMAEKQTVRILRELGGEHPCHAACVVHRTGDIPVGETAVYAGVAAAHRAEAFALLSAFMDRLKQDVPIWKVGVLPLPAPDSISE
ncbi:MAG: molybdenum cofactor biosynthesis protein MoaE [Opitutales bacterium]|nr:molybdenum cofactor biosynthesis protein MoaE [Opitutales bacterium]